MKYERLTERKEDRYWQDEELWTSAEEPDIEEIDSVYSRLAELEDKIEDGTLVNRQVAAWYEETNNTGDIVYHCSVCEDAFMLLEGTPEENNYHFCPNCGSEIGYVYPTDEKE